MKVGDLVRVKIDSPPNNSFPVVLGVLVEQIATGKNPWWVVFRSDIHDTNKYHEKWITVINESR